ncbi:MAG: ubiquinone/menaquinone biosynthesis methyltransferase [bacterium]
MDGQVLHRWSKHFNDIWPEREIWDEKHQRNEPRGQLAGRRGEEDSRMTQDLHRRSRETWVVSDPRRHGRAVRTMFARIVPVYDFMNHFLSLNRDRAWRRDLVRCIDTNATSVLDLCTGSGDLALDCAEAGKGRLILATDFCPEMLLLASRKIGRLSLDNGEAMADSPDRPASRIKLSAADVLDLPFPAAVFDAVTVGFGVRNLADIRRGLREVLRVLRPGGQLLILDFFRADPNARENHRGPPGGVRWLLHTVLPFFGRLAGRNSAAYAYLCDSMDEFLTPTQLTEVMREVGFVDIFVRRQTLGIAHLIGGRLAGEMPT